MANGRDGLNGLNGQSAYELALAHGFRGTFVDWLEKLSQPAQRADMEQVVSAISKAILATKDQGPKGDRGPRGEVGSTGEVGERGLIGKAGDSGRDGKDGTKGERGPKGDTGTTGLPPDHEWEGKELRFRRPDGQWGPSVDLEGPKGPQGAAGRRGGGGGFALALPDGTLAPTERFGRSAFETWLPRTSSAGVIGFVGSTWQTIIAVRRPAYAVRLQYINATTASYTVTKTSITPSSTLVLGGDPTGGVTPVNVLWGGAADVVVPAASGAGVTAYSAFSDWMPVQPLARTDLTTAYPLWHLRSFLANAGGADFPFDNPQGYASYPGNVIGGLVRAGGYQTGVDRIAVPAGFVGNQGTWLQVNIQFQSLASVTRVAGIGDSIMETSVPSSLGGSANSYGEKACEVLNNSLEKIGCVFSFENYGWSSQTYAQLLARLPALLANSPPDVLLLPIGSVNSAAFTEATSAANISLCLDAVRQCRAANVIPVLLAVTARNSDNATVSDWRRRRNTLFAQMCADQAIAWADIAAVPYGDGGADPEQINPLYSVDGLHPNDAGNTLLAPIIAAAILRALRY